MDRVCIPAVFVAEGYPNKLYCKMSSFRWNNETDERVSGLRGKLLRSSVKYKVRRTCNIRSVGKPRYPYLKSFPSFCQARSGRWFLVCAFLPEPVVWYQPACDRVLPS